MHLSIDRLDARRAALVDLIDYAGLFPPASLDMAAAVAEYRDARRRPEGWMVDGFVAPASRLEELAAAIVPTAMPDDPPWSLRLIVDGIANGDWLEGARRDAVAARTFGTEMAGAVSVDIAEVRLPAGTPADSIAAVAVAFDPAMVFFEVAWKEGDVVAVVERLADVRASERRMVGVKVRCGGATADDVPDPGVLARVIVRSRDLGLPLKATAGLHHPVRRREGTTVQHGFLNVITAAAIAHEGADLDQVEAVLADGDVPAFGLEAGGLRWRDRRWSAEQLRATRSGLFVGLGSCSVEEPVEDLVAMGVLPLESS